MEGLCEAFVKINSAGVTHGDIKAGNVVVAVDGSMRFIDWGDPLCSQEPHTEIFNEEKR